jgi:putative nucleotidyltransferase with HDIG domain
MRECEEFKVNPTLGANTLAAALQVMSTPPPAVVALNTVLGTSPIDLQQLGCIGRSHPAAATQILRLCNSSIFRLSRPVSSLEQAVVSLGAEVLRTLGLAWGLVDFTGKYLPSTQAQAFWQHGLTLALLSERIAERMDYPVAEAYLAGFLHDIGRVPILVATTRRKHSCRTGNSTNDGDCPEIELRNFGVDHCELGQRIGMAWGFSEAFVEVFSRHHGSGETAEETELVRIVSAGERFCAQAASGSQDAYHRIHRGRNGKRLQLFNTCLPDLEMAESLSLAEILEFEFLQAAQRLRLGALNRFSPAVQGSMQG